MSCALLLALGGCLQQAADKDFDFDNAADTTTSDADEEIKILYIDRNSDIVAIGNLEGEVVDMTGWELTNETTATTFTFPAFALVYPGVVFVHNTADTDDSQNLYNSGLSWSVGETATLTDEFDGLVDTCSQPSECFP